MTDPAVEIELLAAADCALDRLFAAAPVEELERLARRYFTPSALARRRLGERNLAIYRLAAVLLAGGGEASGHSLADRIAAEVGRYASSTWRHERDRTPPADPRRALLHRILVLGRGDFPGRHQLRRILAGLAHKQPRQ